MRFTLSLLGTEILSISTGEPAADSPGEHDTNCSQAELSGTVPVGFHIQANPSVSEVERDA